MLALGLVMGCGEEPVQSTPTNTEVPNPEKNKTTTRPTTPKGINQTSEVTIGTPIWEFNMSLGVHAPPAISSDGTVYIGTGFNLYAINGETGAKLWEFKSGPYLTSPAINSAGTVYAACWTGKLYAINGKTGVKIWEFDTFETGPEAANSSSPAIGSDGTVYVGSNDKKIYAIKGKTGTKKWEFETGRVTYAEGCSPTIGTDGTVYMGGDDAFYAIKTKSQGPAKSPWPMRGQNAQHTGRALKKE